MEVVLLESFGLGLKVVMLLLLGLGLFRLELGDCGDVLSLGCVFEGLGLLGGELL